MMVRIKGQHQDKSSRSAEKREITGQIEPRATYLKRLFIHGDLRLQTCQVEVILDELLGHLSKVFVARQSAEAGDPGLGRPRRGRHGDGKKRRKLASLNEGLRAG
jgi:hypothetical protein